LPGINHATLGSLIRPVAVGDAKGSIAILGAVQHPNDLDVAIELAKLSGVGPEWKAPHPRTELLAGSAAKGVGGQLVKLQIQQIDEAVCIAYGVACDAIQDAVNIPLGRPR
jgi:hypothetical protein